MKREAGALPGKTRTRLPLFGWFAVRLSGVYLAMLTLAFAQIVWAVVFQWETLTGGSNGVLGIWPPAPFNRPISPLRHLGVVQRPTEELLDVKRSFDVKLNDVLLAACSRGLRRFMADHGDDPVRLKTMVPVSVRPSGEGGALGTLNASAKLRESRRRIPGNPLRLCFVFCGFCVPPARAA